MSVECRQREGKNEKEIEVVSVEDRQERLNEQEVQVFRQSGRQGNSEGKNEREYRL